MANTGVIQGQDLLLYIETATGVWTPIAHATSHTIEPNMEVRDRASKDTGKWKGKVAGLLGWTASAEALALYDSYSWHDLYALFIARTKVKLKLAGRATATDATWVAEQTADKYVEGDAYITSMPLTAPNNEDATMSITFEGDGKLEPKTVPAPQG
jgi:predicted secreted protein